MLCLLHSSSHSMLPVHAFVYSCHCYIMWSLYRSFSTVFGVGCWTSDSVHSFRWQKKQVRIIAIEAALCLSLTRSHCCGKKWDGCQLGNTIWFYVHLLVRIEYSHTSLLIFKFDFVHQIRCCLLCSDGWWHVDSFSLGWVSSSDVYFRSRTLLLTLYDSIHHGLTSRCISLVW